jgi:hypothetical protein
MGTWISNLHAGHDDCSSTVSMTQPAKITPDREPAGPRHEGADRTNQATLRVGEALRLYHRHRVGGMNHLEAALRSHRPVLLVGNHCMDVVDPLMLRTAVHAATGRLLPFIAHELGFFRLPGLRSFMTAAAVIPSRDPDLAERALCANGMLALYPGAGSEASLRLYRREPYQLKWYGRLGFVELALRANAVILFVAGIGIDEMYYQTDLRVPRAIFRLLRGTYLEEYRGIRLQLGAAGIHLLPGIWPLPVRVTHVISAPIRFNHTTDPGDRSAVEKTQIHVWAACQRFLDDAVAARDEHSDYLDSVCRRGIEILQEIGV